MRWTAAQFEERTGRKLPARRTPDPVVTGATTGQMRLVLPYPPSTNHLYCTQKRGEKLIRTLSEEGEAYKQTAGLLAKQQGAFLLTGDVSLTFRVYRPRKARDLSNCFKVAEDALTGICWRDDKQVVELHAYRFDDPQCPRIEVEITGGSYATKTD